MFPGDIYFRVIYNQHGQHAESVVLPKGRLPEFLQDIGISDYAKLRRRKITVYKKGRTQRAAQSNPVFAISALVE